MEASDFLTDDTGDLIISNGDFAVGLSDVQHAVDIIESNPGDWKEYPTCGVGIDNYLNARTSQQEIYNKTRLQLIADGYQVEDIKVLFDTSGNLVIQPYATRN